MNEKIFFYVVLYFLYVEGKIGTVKTVNYVLFLSMLPRLADILKVLPERTPPCTVVNLSNEGMK